MIDIRSLLQAQRPQMVPQPMPTPMANAQADQPTLQWGGQPLTPDNPAYEVIKRLILKRYGMLR